LSPITADKLKRIFMSNDFRGFSKQASQFLEENHVRDDKTWFEENRPVYNELLLNPFKNLVTALSGTITSIDAELDTKAAVGRTISKIYRDTRFAKNKSLFHSAMWITFKRREEGWQGTPAYFFEIAPELWRYGMGYFAPSRETMDNYREMIDEDLERFAKMVNDKNTIREFDLCGNVYVRPIKKDVRADIERWYNRKELYLSHTEHNFSPLYDGGFVDKIKESFLALSPLYKFLRMAAEKSIHTNEKRRVHDGK